MMEFICKIFGQVAVVFMVLYLFFMVLVQAAKAEPNICAIVVPQARILEYSISRIPEKDRHGKIYWRMKNNQRVMRKHIATLCGVDLSKWPY